MKKILSLLALTVVTLSANAQSEHMEAFKNFGCGVEVGTMGAGVQVSMPVVTNHLVFVLGYNAMNYNLDYTVKNLSNARLNGKINDLNKQVRAYNQYVAPTTGKTFNELNPLDDDIDIDASAKLNLSNFKVLFEYYPFEKSSFHITAGAMIGQDYMLKIKGVADEFSRERYLSTISLNKDVIAAPGGQLKDDHGIVGIEDLEKSLRLNLDNTTYHLDDIGRIDASLAINRVRPYVGIGFGRAIPNKRVGFQFELGAWFHGSPSLKSSNELDYYDDEAITSDSVEDYYKLVKSLSVYPQLTFRLTGRIF